MKMKNILLVLLFALLVMSPASAMIKDSVYVGADSVAFNTTTFFVSQPSNVNYFQSPYEGDLRESDGFYYPVAASFNPYPSGTVNGTLNVQVNIFYENLTTEVVVNENITFADGATYSDSDDDIAVAWIQPLDSVAYVTLTRIEGNFTVLKRNVWYKQYVTLNKPNLDSLTSAIVSLVTWTQTLLDDVIAPVLNTFIQLWEYLLKWVVVLLAIAWSVKAVFLGYHMIADGGEGKKKAVKRGR